MKKNFFRNTSLTLLLSMSSCMMLNHTAFADTNFNPSITRLSGSDRFLTNLKVIQNNYTDSSEVVITTGLNFPDAISAIPYSELKKAPLFLVSNDQVSKEQLDTICSLKPNKITIIGGTGAVSSKIENQILNRIQITPSRLCGANRYETSLDIAKNFKSNKVFIVSGDNFPDSLSITPAAAKEQVPVILVPSNPNSNLEFIAKLQEFIVSNGITSATLIGGPAVVPNFYEGLFNEKNRIYGENRYETNYKINSIFSQCFNQNKIYLTTGGNFPDAISGALVASRNNNPLYITTRKPDNNLKDAIRSTTASSITVVGGDFSVRDYTVNNLIYDTPITVDELDPMTDEEIAVIRAREEEIKRQNELAVQSKYDHISSMIGDYLSPQSGSYGFYMIDLTNNHVSEYNSNTLFTGASTVKLPINLYAYELRRQGLWNYDTQIAYTSDDYEGGTGILQGQHLNRTFSAGYLSKLSIIYSDNIAVNMLLRNVRGDGFNEYLGNVLGRSIVPWKNRWTAKDMGLIMKTIYNFINTNQSNGLGPEFLYNLTHTIFNDRLNRDLPEDVMVAHKIGTNVRCINDVGIVYADHPYVVAFMSDGVDEDEAKDVIAHASRMIYDYIESLK